MGKSSNIERNILWGIINVLIGIIEINHDYVPANLYISFGYFGYAAYEVWELING